MLWSFYLNLLLLCCLQFQGIPAQEVCHFTGQCLTSAIDFSTGSSYNDCLEQCKAKSCQFFTFYGREHSCAFFSNCEDGPVRDECPFCYTGQGTCAMQECHLQGFYYGAQLQVQEERNTMDCQQQCQQTINCEYFTFDYNTHLCFMYSEVNRLDAFCEYCRSGRVSCPMETGMNKILLTNVDNVYDDVFEVIDLAKNEQNCLTPLRYPYSNGRYGIRATYMEGRILACGGEFDDNACYAFDPRNNRWDKKTSTRNTRLDPGHVKLNDSAWWLLGGGYPTGKLSEIYNADSNVFQEFSFPSDLLPENAESNDGNCLLKINDTHVFSHFLGGYSTDNDTFIYELLNDEWRLVENSPSFDELPVCGLITRSGGEQEIVLAWGDSRGNSNRNSSILSLIDLSWRPGPEIPLSMSPFEAASVQYEDSFLVLGGYEDSDNLGYRKSDRIHRYDVATDSWVELPLRLRTEARLWNSATLVPHDAVNC